MTRRPGVSAEAQLKFTQRKGDERVFTDLPTVDGGVLSKTRTNRSGPQFDGRRRMIGRSIGCYVADDTLAKKLVWFNVGGFFVFPIFLVFWRKKVDLLVGKL